MALRVGDEPSVDPQLDPADRGAVPRRSRRPAASTRAWPACSHGSRTPRPSTTTRRTSCARRPRWSAADASRPPSPKWGASTMRLISSARWSYRSDACSAPSAMPCTSRCTRRDAAERHCGAPRQAHRLRLRLRLGLRMGLGRCGRGGEGGRYETDHRRDGRERLAPASWLHEHGYLSSRRSVQLCTVRSANAKER